MTMTRIDYNVPIEQEGFWRRGRRLKEQIETTDTFQVLSLPEGLYQRETFLVSTGYIEPITCRALGIREEHWTPIGACLYPYNG